MHVDLRNSQSHLKYHFIGIGGIGMSALALILLQRGNLVSGSDQSASAMTDYLQSQGAQIFIGHQESNVQDPSFVIYSTAVKEENPEVKRAREKQIPFLHRSELLAQLMEGYAPLLVAGTHGKTTTSSLLAHVVVRTALNPSYAIGGIVQSLGSNGGYGTGSYFVAEADESDGSFLKYHPFGAIITNIDNDHFDYWKTEEALVEGFRTFANGVNSPEHLFWCGDDVKLQEMNLKGVSYGFGEGNQLKVENYRQEGWHNVFDLSFDGKTYLDIEIPLIGAHNVLNAASVFGMGLRLNIEEEALRTAFKSFKGIGRRVEKKGQWQEVPIYDDYGHHPTEVSATLRAVKNAIGHQRLVVAFQPHRFTRTRDCLHDFGPAFNHADVLFLTDIYSAGESPIEGVSTEILLEKIRSSTKAEVHYLPRDKMAPFLKTFFKTGDTFVTMGAGDITKLGPELLK